MKVKMRGENEMLGLIIKTAAEDSRILAVIMEGSRANPESAPDPFRDFDIVYLVEAVEPFVSDKTWIKRFGEIMIMQMPEEMKDPPPENKRYFSFLMQFTDGNRIDLTLRPAARFKEFKRSSASLLLLDKKGLFGKFAPAGNSDFLPKPPSAKAFSDACNEFWWVCPYVAKGLWRGEIIYSKYMLESVLREELMKMLAWYIGGKTQFKKDPGKHGKNFKKYLEADLWALLLRTYSGADAEDIWDALLAMCDLFRTAANQLAKQFNFEYPENEGKKVVAHLKHVRELPGDAKAIY